MVNKDLGMVTAYAYAVSKGYTGTEEEFAALMADYAAVGQRAEAAATAAAASATAASGSASDSAASATAAEGFAENASTAAGNASQAAQNASQSASAAGGSATSAAGSATAAAGSATTAGNKATEAAQSATAAAGSATTAGASATAAQAAQTAAGAAQTAAETAQGAAEDAAESVSASVAQIDQNTEDISLLKSHLNATEIVDTASGAIASFTDGSDGIPVKELIVNIEPIQEGTGDPSPENVRPISGRQSVTVTRAGVNWFDIRKFAEVYPNTCSYNESTGELTLIAHNALFSTGIEVNIPLDESNGGYLQCDINNGTATNVRIKVHYADGSMYQTPDSLSSGYVVQTLVLANKRVTSIRLNWSTAGTFKIKNFCITQGTTAVEYIAPQFQTIQIPLGQTVYGGTVDVVSGEMTVDRAMVDLGTLTWSYSSSSGHERFMSGVLSPAAKIVDSNTVANIKCSQYKANTVNRVYTHYEQYIIATDGDGAAWVYDPSYTDAASFKTAMNGVQLCYELAQPITITLTPEQLTTILGTNNVWSDADSVSVDYVADTKLYIQKAISAAVAALS